MCKPKTFNLDKFSGASAVSQGTRASHIMNLQTYIMNF